MNLSKSRYTRGVQCPKMLWMEAHLPEQFDDTVLNQAVLATGNEVGDLAMGYYGSFTEIPFDAHDFAGMARLTRELMEAGEPVICEATFERDGNLCMVDILLNEPDGVRLVEVKSSTHLHDIYLHDMAYQCWLLDRCGYAVKSASLMHVNSSYVREGELDLHGLFTVEDCTEVVRGMMGQVGERVAYLKAVADDPAEPGESGALSQALGMEPGARGRCSIGPHCRSPYPCGYQRWCWRYVPHPSVFDLGGYGLVKAFKLVDQGLLTFDDVADSGLRLKAIPQRQIEAHRTGESPLVDVAFVRRFLAELTPPLYFLDFETYQPAVPPFDGVRPYQQIPTQFSLHVVSDAEGAFEHREFLAREGTDPRRAVAEALVRAIPRDARTVAYNMSFERMVLKDLAVQFPDLAAHLLAIRENMRDLMVPFRNGAYYAAAQGGSFSIKSVLPALFPDDPELDYHALDGVHNGAQASAAFTDLAHMVPEEAARTREALLRYCELDTLAMVRIWQKLQEVVA
ncbi:DUF2779 domain-containing protein [Adlercreutzia sp. ZJ473]|uniref:DUF2779 domain-containing protein n=1 Tax=Adlercreutzia sp. ZJ473 TaxID=2722822 RepID=UPI00155522D0|nr:DUF2779 domain-containing protein [Adlercreutzia sp. ZJ473]